MSDFGHVTNFIWGVADLIRDSFKRGKYQDVILPFTVLRRLDCVLAPTAQLVRETNHMLIHEKNMTSIHDRDDILKDIAEYAFYNTSPYDFKSLLAEGDKLQENLGAYLRGFSPNMADVLEKFDFPNTIKKLDQQGLLYLVMKRFSEIDLHPDTLDNHAMGSVFEELIRKFNDATNENPGEHFTPRDVVSLMARLMLEPDKEKLRQPGINKEICDPCCGTGGMLTLTRDLARDMGLGARFFFYGQEVNPETYAICKSDLFMQSADGKNAENIKFGSTLAIDRHEGKQFDYLIANPPYGKDWKRDKDEVETEHNRYDSRFSPGLPRISDGQLLFALHMAHHMKPARLGGSRVALIMNGSPLFTGDAGSGESNIRRHLIEKDLVEAIVALPEQLFYNTSIATYVWILNSAKEGTARAGKIQLINANGEDFWKPMRKSLGDKRREISEEQAARIIELYMAFEENKHSKIFRNRDFGYHKVTVERPLRLKFRASEAELQQLREHKNFMALASSKKKDPTKKAEEVAAGIKTQEAYLKALAQLPSEEWVMDRAVFLKQLDTLLKAAGQKPGAPLKQAILSSLGERDEKAAICRNKKGEMEPDPELRDTESIPLAEDINAYMCREVLPHVPDAWAEPDPKIGYEIPFTRHFYEYQPLRPLAEIEGEIRELEAEIQGMLGEVFS